MKNKSEVFSSPAEGNAFGLAMQKAGGDYDKAKAMMDSSPAAYGTGSPFKLMKDKKVTSVKSEGFKNKSVVSPSPKHVCAISNGDPIVKDLFPYDLPYLKSEAIALIHWLEDNREQLKPKH